MNESWGSNRQIKIDDLKTAIDEISSKILCTSIKQDDVDGEWKDVCDEPGEDTTGDKLLNRVGFVPFNVRTREIVSGNQARATSQLSYKDNYKTNVSPYSYNDVNWDYWRTYSQNDVIRCADRESRCSYPKADNQKYAKRIKDVIYQDNYRVADVYNYVDLPTSVRSEEHTSELQSR